jgi:hypothetical protein
MKRRITETQPFTQGLNSLLKKRKISQVDFDEFKNVLIENPDEGEIVSGTGGVRKTRLKSISKGKREGFRVCYYYDPQEEEIFLLLLYPKNVQEDLSSEEKKALKEITKIFKRR